MIRGGHASKEYIKITDDVEAAVCRQLISARRPSRDSRYAAFLSIHCAYTLVAHTCVITVIPHMCIQINCTVLNCLPYCLVVYASATISNFCENKLPMK